MKNLTAVSLFSGCGGSDIGAHNAGVNVIYANDSSLLAIRTYRKYWRLVSNKEPEIIAGDIRKIEKLPTCDILIGCYPCQCFTMGGHRLPKSDPRNDLFKEFSRCISVVNPRYFITENVPGMAWLNKGIYLKDHLKKFRASGKNYRLSVELINAKDYGVPQERKRIVIVGIRTDLKKYYWFPRPTHGDISSGLEPWVSHGDSISSLPRDPKGEYYDYKTNPYSWWYMSRNRKKKWENPSYAIQANWRHVPLHPASPCMKMVESNLRDKWKQKWEFTNFHDHLDGHPERIAFRKPRRLSWRECAIIQTFPHGFEPEGSVEKKFMQIGNATPPQLMEILVRGIVNGNLLRIDPYISTRLNFEY